MNNHPMRRNEREITDPNLLRDIIEKNNVAVVSMTDGIEPYGVMMNYAPHFEKEKIFLIFHGALNGRKIECLRIQPRVSVFINDIAQMKIIDAGTESAKWTTHYRSVILSGKMRFIEDLSFKFIAAKRFMRHYTNDPLNLPDAALNATIFLECEAEHISGKQNPMQSKNGN